jgi:hypothetical protein
MTRAVLALALVLALGAPAREVGAPVPARAAADAAETPTNDAALPGTLVLPAGHRGTLRVLDEGGATIATVTLRPEHGAQLVLPPGRWRIDDDAGTHVADVELAAGARETVALPSPLRAAPAPRAEPHTVPPPRLATATAPRSAMGPAPARRRLGPRPWKRWGAPLLSAIVPGLGHAISGEPGRGLGMFAGTVGLVLGSVGLWTARARADGATPGEGRSDALEVTRLLAFAGTTTAAGLLYPAQILDAHRAGAGKRVRPRRGYAVAIDVGRAVTVAFRPGEPGYALYPDASASVMGQVARRVAFGLSDLAVHRSDAPGRPLTIEAGLRATYRFYDRDRVWLAAGGGLMVQGTTARAALPPLDPDAARPRGQSRFSAIPYVLGELRVFVLDRWSVVLGPRFSVPLGARDFGRGRVLPRYAPTFELLAGLGVVFG